VMVDTLAEVERRHGGVEGYLRDAGLAPETLDRIRERLLAPRDTIVSR